LKLCRNHAVTQRQIPEKMVMQIIPEISLKRLKELAKPDHRPEVDSTEKEARFKRKYDLSTAAALHAQSEFHVTLIIRSDDKLYSITTFILSVNDQSVTIEKEVTIPLSMVAVVDFF